MKFVKRKEYGLASRLKKSSVSYAMMAPYMIVFILLTVIPVIAAICLSFTYFNMLEPPKFTGLLNYERLFLDDEIFPQVLKNTLVFAIITGPLSYLISFVSAWLINEMGRAVRTVMTFCFYAPALCGNLYAIWAMILSGDQYGIANSVLMQLGVISEPQQWLSDPKTMLGALITVQLWASFGVGFLTFIAGFQSMDKSLAEAGGIDGIKNRWQELWYITLPSMAPQLLFSAVMQIAACFGVGALVQSLAGFPTTQYSADTLLTYMLDVGTVRFEMGYASAIAVFLFVMMMFTNFVVLHIIRRIGR